MAAKGSIPTWWELQPEKFGDGCPKATKDPALKESDISWLENTGQSCNNSSSREKAPL